MSMILSFFEACKAALGRKPRAIAVEDLSEEELSAIAEAEVPENIEYEDEET